MACLQDWKSLLAPLLLVTILFIVRIIDIHRVKIVIHIIVVSMAHIMIVSEIMHMNMTSTMFSIV